MTTHAQPHRRPPLFKYHSLTIVTVAILLTWLVSYYFSDPNTHHGSFFGNAVADWLGSVVMILGTKYLYERGSAECRRVRYPWLNHPVMEFLREHSLSIFLIITGAGWVYAFVHMDPNGKWGQVVGNIVSEWTQAFGLIVLTKKLIERGSPESKQH
jgi:peptidoglycan/LPS O-acetylase OafA/YrhL